MSVALAPLMHKQQKKNMFHGVKSRNEYFTKRPDANLWEGIGQG